MGWVRGGGGGGQAFVDVVAVFMLDFSNFLHVFKTCDVVCQCLEFLLEFCDFGVRHGGNSVAGDGDGLRKVMMMGCGCGVCAPFCRLFGSWEGRELESGKICRRGGATRQLRVTNLSRMTSGV